MHLVRRRESEQTFCYVGTKLACMIPGACQPDRTRMSGGRVTDHQLSINSVHGVYGGTPSLVLITSACQLDFTWKLRLCSLRRCVSLFFSSSPVRRLAARSHRLMTTTIQRIMKFCVTKDSRETSCECLAGS